MVLYAPYTPGQVKSQAAPTVVQRATHATPDAFGANQGQAMKDMGQGMDDVARATMNRAREMQREDDERELKTLDSSLSSALRLIELGDVDGTGGVTSIKSQALNDMVSNGGLASLLGSGNGGCVPFGGGDNKERSS